MLSNIFYVLFFFFAIWSLIWAIISVEKHFLQLLAALIKFFKIEFVLDILQTLVQKKD